MSVIVCRTCGYEMSVPKGQELVPCLACGTNNSVPVQEADVGDMLRRATAQRLRCDFVHAESSYQYVLRESPEEHEALWGLVQCRYAIEYVKDPRTGKPMPIVHGVQKRPMLTDPDFREACDLAPEAVKKEYRAEAEYIDGAMAHIRDLAATGEPFDVFLCHKTSRTDGVEGYTEDYNRAVQLYIMLRDMGYRVFFAPFAGLTPGDNYEAGIYHALSTARVMLVICSNQEYINSPWVRTEWQRFLEMSYEPGADKHLIPLLYGDLPPRRLPDDFRQLQAITMGELNAKEKLMAAIRKHTGEKATARQAVEPTPAPKEEPQPVEPPKPVSVPKSEPKKPAPKPAPVVKYAPESNFETKAVAGGVRIAGYTGPGGEVLIPPTIGGEQVVEIGENAFEEQEQLTKVVIPEGVTSIGYWAFSDCSSLTSITLPDSVTTIGAYAFSRCSNLTSVSIPESVTSISFSAFEDCTGLTSVTIPQGVTSIGSLAFDGCTGLTSVHIPNSVTSIEESAFRNCSSLISVNIPDSVTSIGVWAFSYCSGLTTVSIPQSVTSIEDWAFEGCTGLTTVSIPQSVTSIGDSAFRFCSALTLRVHAGSVAHTYAQQNNLRFELIAPMSQLKPAQAASKFAQPTQKPTPKPAQPAPAYAPESDFETEAADGGVAITGYSGPGGEVLIPPTIGGMRVVEIGENAFKEQEKLTKVVIPEGVSSIGEWAFKGCSSLTSVDIPESVTSIGVVAFSDCSSLTSVDIPAGVTSIREFAFEGCSSLTSVNIPDTVTSIGLMAFEGCSSLTSVNIPDTVTSIEEWAFDQTTTLCVHVGSTAHTYAQESGYLYELISSAPQSVQPTPQYQEKPSLFSRLFGKK